MRPEYSETNAKTETKECKTKTARPRPRPLGSIQMHVEVKQIGLLYYLITIT